jgi:hypothetical protein
VHPSCPYIAAKACRSMHVGGKQGNKNNFPFPFPSHTSHGAHTKIAFDRMQSLESMSDTYPMHDAPPYPRWTPHSAPTREYFRVSSHAPSRLANRDHLLDRRPSPRARFLSAKGPFLSLKASVRGSSRQRPLGGTVLAKPSSLRASRNLLGGHAPRGPPSSR